MGQGYPGAVGLLNVDLSPELENLILPRPTSYVLAQQVNRVDSKAEAYAKAARRAGRPYNLREQLVNTPNAIVLKDSHVEKPQELAA
jgi:hypothetical protein